jgi:hypothetical protein
MESALLEVIETDAGAEEDAEANPQPERRRPGVWGILLLLVIVFGYLTAARREAIGKFAEQVADIVRDFRGYDPEF